MKKGIYILKANSPTIHKLGDIRREKDDLFRVQKDLGDECSGMFVFGYGFADVRVKKSDLRALTQKEWEEKYEKHGVRINNQPSMPL